jgi:hypothetical protein
MKRPIILTFGGFGGIVFQKFVPVILYSLKPKSRRRLKMFPCQGCGKCNLPDSKFCRHCGDELLDGTDRVAVLLVPVSPCHSLEGYKGMWRVVWFASDLRNTVNLATGSLVAYGSKGMIAVFEREMMEGKILVSTSHFRCYTRKGRKWPCLHEVKNFTLENFEVLASV